MANWDTLKSAIAGVIGANGNQAITGQILQNTLHNIISSVGENATFVGIATPTTNPGVPDGPVFYLATEAGIYANFDGIEVIEGEAAILQWSNGAWSKKTSGFVTEEQLRALESEIGIKKLFVAEATSTTRVLNDINFRKGVTYRLTSSCYVIEGRSLYLQIIEDGNKIYEKPIGNEETYEFSFDHDVVANLTLVPVGGKMININLLITTASEISDVKSSLTKIESLDTKIESLDTKIDNVSIKEITKFQATTFIGTIKIYKNVSYRILANTTIDEGRSLVLQVKIGENVVKEYDIYKGDTDITTRFDFEGEVELYFVPLGGGLLVNRFMFFTENNMTAYDAGQINNQNSLRNRLYNFGAESIQIPVNIFSGIGDKCVALIKNKSTMSTEVEMMIYLNTPDIGNDRIRAVVMPRLTLMEGECRTLDLEYGRADLAYYLLNIYGGGEIEVELYDHHYNTILKSTPFFIPGLGNQLIISRDIDLYCHDTSIVNSKSKIYIIYHTSSSSADESRPNLYDYCMAIYDKRNGHVSHRSIVSDFIRKDYYNEHEVLNHYNQNAVIKDGLLYLIYGCKSGGETMRLFTTYNTESGEISQPYTQKLSYNGKLVSWTLSNYIDMINNMYGYSYEQIKTLYALDTTSIFEYKGIYYMMVGHRIVSKENTRELCPVILMTSTDLISWRPIKVVGEELYAEPSIAIANDMMLFLYRTEGGTYKMVLDLNGNILSEKEQISHIDSKPSTFSVNGKLYGIYNIEGKDVHTVPSAEFDNFYGHYFGRTKVAISLLKDDFSFEKVAESYNSDGWQYFNAGVYENQVILSNTLDFKCENRTTGLGPTNSVGLTSLSNLEL